MSHRLAPSTWRRHLYLDRTLTEYSNRTRRRLTADVAIEALNWIGTGTTARTLLSYARTVRAMAKVFRTDAFDKFIQGLAARATLEPLNQAETLTKTQIEAIMMRAPEGMRWAIWLTWLTSSRWADTQGLSKERVLFFPTGAVVDFQGATKTTRKCPHRLDHLVWIPSSVQGFESFRQWCSAQRTWLLPRITTGTVTLLIRKWLPGVTGATCHSLKRSALKVLLTAVVEKRLPMWLVPQMAKHKGLEPLLPDMTVGYIQDRALLAITNRSAEAVKILDFANPLGREDPRSHVAALIARQLEEATTEDDDHP